MKALAERAHPSSEVTVPDCNGRHGPKQHNVSCPNLYVVKLRGPATHSALFTRKETYRKSATSLVRFGLPLIVSKVRRGVRWQISAVYVLARDTSPILVSAHEPNGPLNVTTGRTVQPFQCTEKARIAEATHVNPTLSHRWWRNSAYGTYNTVGRR